MGVPFIYQLTFFAVVGGFLFGYDTGVVSGAMLLLKKDFSLSDAYQSAIVSVTMAFASVFSLFGGPLNNRFGRRKIMVFSASQFLLGSITIAFAKSKGFLILGRAVLGIAIGLTSMTSNIYIAECAPPHIRGKLVTFNNVAITFGQFLAAWTDGMLSETSSGWRFMFGLAVIPSVIQLIGFLFFIPESPRWLLSKNLNAEAESVLRQIRQNDYSDTEFHEIKESCTKSEFSGLVDFIKKFPKRVLIIGIGLQIAQQLAGINSIMYYSATVMKLAGFNEDSEAIWKAADLAFVNFCFGLVSIYAVEKYGRRKLLIFSMTGTIIALFIIALGLKSVDAGSDIQLIFSTHFSSEKIPFYGMVLYLLFFSMGFGPLPWTVNAELYANEEQRALGNSISTFANWQFNFIVSSTFLYLTAQHGSAYPYFLYAFFTAFSLVLFILYLPETKGVKLEDMDNLRPPVILPCCRSQADDTEALVLE